MSLVDLGISTESFRHPKSTFVKVTYGRWQWREINCSSSKTSNAQGSEKTISGQKGMMFHLQVKDKAVTQRGGSNHKSDSTSLIARISWKSAQAVNDIEKHLTAKEIQTLDLSFLLGSFKNSKEKNSVLGVFHRMSQWVKTRDCPSVAGVQLSSRGCGALGGRKSIRVYSYTKRDTGCCRLSLVQKSSALFFFFFDL